MCDNPQSRQFETPFQLYADLGTPRLKDYHPVTQAAHDCRVRAAQRRLGIVPLSECRKAEGPLG